MIGMFHCAANIGSTLSAAAINWLIAIPFICVILIVGQIKRKRYERIYGVLSNRKLN